MIQLNSISKSFGQRVLFSEVTFQIGQRERVGLVGRNGTGKSTLFKIIKGEETSDGGNISIPKMYELGALDQHIHFTKETVLEEALLGLKDDEKDDHYKAEKILFGLGFSEEDMQRSPHEFSGGYQIRINLAKVLVRNPSLLLLDEPTNYLDIVSLRWLKRFLVNYPGEVLLITHDRGFMDDIVTHTVGIHRQKVRKIKGKTAQYYEQVLSDEEIYEKTRLNQEKKKKEIQSFVDRFGAKATKAKQAQSRLKQLEKMETMEELAGIENIGFHFQYEDFPAKTLMEGHELSFGYTQELLFEKLKFVIGKKDRIGIIGKNGKGKSTLLNLIAKELTQNSGELKEHPKIKKAHFGQTNIERLHMSNTIEQEIQECNSELSHTDVRGICGSMMFSADLAEKKISVLSGGERARVMLGKIIAKKCNLLLLDEPTNHLDMETIEILIQEVERFPGAVVVVTHDEQLLRAVTNKLIIFREGSAELFDGGYDDFIEKIGWDDEEPVKTKVDKSSKRPSKHERAQLIKERAKELNPLKKELEEIEADIMSLEEVQEKLTSLLEMKAQSGDDISEISMKIGQINSKVEEKFLLMEEKQEKLDQIIQKYEGLEA